MNEKEQYNKRRMEGTRVVTLDDRAARIKIEVWQVNDWYFSRYRIDGKGPQPWRNTPKPYRHTLGAIRGAYYSGTGKV